MRYFLDTNIIVYAVKGKFPKIRKHFASVPSTSIVIPSIVCAELEFGARCSRDYNRSMALYSAFLKQFQIVPFGKKEAETYGVIRSQLKSTGTPIGPNDMVIAACALNNGVLVTHNTREFSRVIGLSLEDWTA